MSTTSFYDYVVRWTMVHSINYLRNVTWHMIVRFVLRTEAWIQVNMSKARTSYEETPSLIIRTYIPIHITTLRHLVSRLHDINAMLPTNYSSIKYNCT